jgi:hypothetical protein
LPLAEGLFSEYYVLFGVEVKNGHCDGSQHFACLYVGKVGS